MYADTQQYVADVLRWPRFGASAPSGPGAALGPAPAES